MIQQERQFQYLIALAVAGEISDIELEELLSHTARCSSCSQRMAEMESANLQLFLTLAAQGKNPRISSEMQERFLTRAAHSGVPIAVQSSAIQRSNFLHFAAIVVAVCLFVGVGWRHIRHGSLEQAHSSSSPMGIAEPAQLVATTDSDLTTSETQNTERSIDRRHKRHAADHANILSSFDLGRESRISARSLFRLDTAVLSSQPRAINTEAGLSGIQHLAVEYFATPEAGLTPRFPAPTIQNASTNGEPDQRVFRYSATLASISFQDDQAIFGLKSRVRDLSISNTLDSNRPKP